MKYGEKKSNPVPHEQLENASADLNIKSKPQVEEDTQHMTEDQPLLELY